MRLPTFIPSFFPRRDVFKANDVQGIEVGCVTLVVGNDYRPLGKEKKVGVRNRIFVTARHDDRERTKAFFSKTRAD